MFVRLAFLEKMAECHGEEFQEFFHDLMSHRYDDYVDIRTHGRLGDQGADGLRLSTRQLFACYAPETFKVSKVETKFNSDLSSAIRQRAGEFDTFVFVCNDRRGTHPEIASLLAGAHTTYSDLKFESMGCRRLWNEIIRLEKIDCENLFGPIPIDELVYGIGMADLKPLLDHLSANRVPADPIATVDEAHLRKMAYNLLSEDCRERLVRGMRYSHLVEQYYEGLVEEVQHDEVAAGFAAYYQQVRAEVGGDDPDEIMWELERYVLGNEYQRPRVVLSAAVVLTHFFERCHIFEVPPPGWQEHQSEVIKT